MSITKTKLTEDEILAYKHLKSCVDRYRDAASFEDKQLTFQHVCEAADDIDTIEKKKQI